MVEIREVFSWEIASDFSITHSYLLHVKAMLEVRQKHPEDIEAGNVHYECERLKQNCLWI